ncbi:MAG: hypothetical protein JWN34_324 [Bryobacterales bacterium]|nr:hypothetical protein [Bryobacterales bacterium]
MLSLCLVIFRPRLLIFVLFLALSNALFSQALFRKPVKVLGDPQYTGTASNPLQFTNNGPNWTDGRELSFPLGIAVDNSVSPPNIYVADAGNNRVLGYRYATQLTAGAKADIVLGQVDFTANLPQGPGGRSTGMSQPTGLASDNEGNLYVADTNNNRILRFPKPLAQPAGVAFPDMVIGQTALSGKTANAGGVSAVSLALNVNTISHTGLAIDAAGNLWVSDTGNNRVLRFPAASLQKGQNGPAADLVLGQNDFVTRTALAGASRLTKTAVLGPQGLSFDTAGRLFVTDSGSRVVVFPAGGGNNAAAIRILGVDPNQVSSAQATSTSLSNALGVAATGAGIVVADTADNRLMTFPSADAWQAETGSAPSPAATAVLGQANFTDIRANRGQGEASSSSLNAPTQVAFSGSEVFVADSQNNRVLVFPAGPSGISSTASRVIGQFDFPFTSANLLEGREFQLSTSISAGSATGTAILDQSATPPHLWVADTGNNRVLGFNDFTRLKNGDLADIVIGQPDLRRALVNYPSNDPALPNAQGLRAPTGLAVDAAGNLYIADTGNSRIVRFASPFKSSMKALQSADLVIGQASFTSAVTDPSDRTMSAPVSVALTSAALDPNGSGGFLIASDAAHNRVLFFPQPFSTGMAASKLLGNLNFFNTVAGSPDPPRFNAPRGVAVDSQDRVIVVDAGNRRVQVFNKAATINSYDSPPISLTGLSLPLSVSTGATGFWVSDAGNNALIHYPLVEQLILKGNSPDASLPVLSPLSVFQDSFSNVLVADGVHRVAYYAPQLSVVSAANYLSRPLTAGSLAAVFPTVASNTLSGATAAAASVPLPTTLGDTQVLVNGTPAPLFYVSAGQINVQLSNGLAPGGSTDVQVVRLGNGQITGGAELQLASAAPGLFTSNGSGGGQVAAINFADNSINSPTNPVARGQTVILYGTGVGTVANAPADGTGATAATPAASKPLVVIGSSTTAVPEANVTYSGLAPTLVGVWQINMVIPDNAQTGSSVALRVFQNSIASTESSSPGGPTTIAIK